MLYKSTFSINYFFPLLQKVAKRSPPKADAVGLLKFLKFPFLNGDDFADLLRQACGASSIIRAIQFTPTSKI
jgi:hypothetical protein